MRPDDCDWLERVNRTFDGAGSLWERWRCRRHSRHCPTCRSWLHRAEAGWRLLQADLDAAVSSPAGFVDHVMQEVRACPCPVAHVLARIARAAHARFGAPATSWLTAGAVAALCAVLIPLHTHNREEVLAATCQDNLRQISTALHVYADDHDDRLPPASDWSSAVRLYAHARFLPHCPSDLSPASLPSYSFVESLGGTSMSALPAGARTPLVYDGHAGLLTRRHDERGNVGFADGHVQPLAQLSLW